MPALTHPYASEAYARAFEGLLDPLAAPALGGWVLARPIEGGALRDAAGCYPLSVLPADLSFEDLRGYVSLVLVADAFFGPPPESLRRSFDLVRPFKSHHIHDFSRPFRYDRHHRYEVKRARTACETRPAELKDHLEDWIRLYDGLCVRHGITGLQRFSRRYFERLAALAGLRALSAWHGGALAGIHLFIEHQGVVYSHLAAFSEDGYRVRASYALNDFALEHFRGARLVDFGAGAGADNDPKDGLAVFKRGFANRTEMFQLCGKILDAGVYARLSAGKSAAAYFPAYRGR